MCGSPVIEMPQRVQQLPSGSEQLSLVGLVEQRDQSRTLGRKSYQLPAGLRVLKETQDPRGSPGASRTSHADPTSGHIPPHPQSPEPAPPGQARQPERAGQPTVAGPPLSPLDTAASVADRSDGAGHALRTHS